MSVKAIREALEAAAMAAPDTNNEELARKVAAAWPEIEAIEQEDGRFLRLLDEVRRHRLDIWGEEGEVYHPEDVDLYAAAERIAKEAP